MDLGKDSNPWNFVGPVSPYFGYVNTREGAEELINHYEVATSSRFCVKGCHKDFGKFACDAGKVSSGKHCIRFEGRVGNNEGNEPTIPIKGIPFIQHGNQLRLCEHGPLWNRKKAEVDNENPAEKKKKRFRLQPSKKCGCRAMIVLREITVFPQYELELDTKHRRYTMSLKIRELLRKNEIEGEHRIYIKLPKPEDHAHHVVGKGSSCHQRNDVAVTTKIREFAKEGITDVGEVSNLIETYVRQEILGDAPLSERKRRLLLPNKRDIQMHINAANSKSKFSKIDQEKLQSLIAKWKKEPERSDDVFHFKRYEETLQIIHSEGSPDIHLQGIENFLFVHQTLEQKRLLKRYGTDICFLDATCKTIKPDCPLFFLVVKTNVDFQVVAEFLTMDITSQAITEALEVIKKQNPDWYPKNFMVGCTDEEVSSLLSLFKSTVIHVCDYQREYAWEEWLNRDTTAPHKEELFTHFRKIARASEESEFEAFWDELQNSDVWQLPDLEAMREWFINTWLENAEKWVWAYRKSKLQPFLRQCNGVDTLSKTFRKDYLQNPDDMTLSEILRTALEQFAPEKYSQYLNSNLMLSSSFRNYNPSLPSYLVDRPRRVINYCRSQLKAAEEILDENIKQSAPGVYSICDAKRTYAVDFNLPSCSCREFSFHGLPCKHMFAIMRSQETWQSLPESYRDSPFLVLDTDLISREALLRGWNTPKMANDETDHEDKAVLSNLQQSEEVGKVVKERAKIRQAMAASCRSKGRILIGLTYTTRNDELLRRAEKKVVEAIAILRSAKDSKIEKTVKDKNVKKSSKTKTVSVQGEKSTAAAKKGNTVKAHHGGASNTKQSTKKKIVVKIPHQGKNSIIQTRRQKLENESKIMQADEEKVAAEADNPSINRESSPINSPLDELLQKLEDLQEETPFNPNQITVTCQNSKADGVSSVEGIGEMVESQGAESFVIMIGNQHEEEENPSVVNNGQAEEQSLDTPDVYDNNDVIDEGQSKFENEVVLDEAQASPSSPKRRKLSVKQQKI